MCHVRVFRNTAHGTHARGTQTLIGPKRLPFAHVRPWPVTCSQQCERAGPADLRPLHLAVNCEQGHIVLYAYARRHGMDDKIAERAKRNPWEVLDEPG